MCRTAAIPSRHDRGSQAGGPTRKPEQHGLPTEPAARQGRARAARRSPPKLTVLGGKAHGFAKPIRRIADGKPDDLLWRGVYLGRLVDLGDDRVELDDDAVFGASDVHAGCRRLVGRPVLEAEVADVVELR